jgi:hypothetical protein
MAFTLEKLKRAREAGYSDEEIMSVASEQNPKIGEAFKSGYSLDDVADYYSTGPQAQSIAEQEQVQNLRQIPEAINQGKGLPIGGEPMVGGPDILAQEQGQTKTFMEDAEGKPVEVRRAQAIDIKGRTIEEPISPDGMSLDFRGNLIKEKTKELQSASGLPYSEYIQKSNTLRSELSKLQKDQQSHEANQLGFLSKLITEKPVSVELETGLGEERVTGAEGKITSVPIQTRASAAIKQIGDQREFIDNIIVNDKFLDYAKTKGIDAPGLISRMAGQYLNVGQAPDQLEELKKNPEVRKLAEEWAMTSPEFMDVTKDIFKRAWDGYAGAIGSGTVGPIGLLLKGAGLEQTGQSFIDAADYADQQRLQGQDPRKVGALAQFGRDVSSGLGFTGAAIVTGALGNTARASLGLNSERAINLFQKANTLTFSGLNSAWQGYSEAKSDGATDEQAKQAALFTALTQAPLELVSPLQKWVSRFDPAQQSRLYKGLHKAATAVIEGTEEALFNEMPQQIAGNLVKKFVYDPNQDIFEGVQYAGGVGGASGILSSIFTQMIAGKKAKKQAQQGDQEGSEQTDIESKADEMAAGLDTDPAQELAQQMMSASTDINNLKEEIANDEMGLQAIEKTAPSYQTAELALNEKKANLAALQTQFDKLSAGPAEKIKPQIQITNIDSIINQGGGTVAVQEGDRDVNFKQFGITIDGNTAEVAFVEIDPSEYGKGIGLEAYRSLGNELSSRGITLRSSGAQYGPGRNLWLKLAQQGNARSIGQGRFEFVAQPKSAAAPTTPTATKETTIAKIDELNKEFDALDENDQVGIDRVNKAIAVEQNKLAELTAIEQGVEPQGTTPTREMGLPPSGRRSEFGTFFPDRPILQAFVKATDKALGAIQATGKRAQKLKNAIRTGITSNAGFLAGTNTEVISSEEYGKLTGGKQVAADTGTYRATFFNGKKYLVVPDVNQLAGISIEGEQRAASRDAALDQESRAAAKKLEEEVIHLSMFQGIQDEYKNIKKPKFSEQEYIVKRISDIAKEVKRTNPNALPGVSEVYLNEKNKNLDDMTFSQEFMRMVIQRVRTGQITEDLNAIRKAEQEAFTDQDKGNIIAWKNSILNALQFVRNSIARYLGKGTSTKEVKRMEDAINNILDEYGIVKGEANYEFKDYSAAEPKGELKAEPTEPTVKESLQVEPALSETITPAIEAKAGVTPEGEPMSKRGQSIMQKITTGMISDLEAQAEMLKPKDNKAYTEYKSRATQKGRKYNQALISPFSSMADLFTSNSFTAANNALDKIFRNNPDADFFDVAFKLGDNSDASIKEAYNLTPDQQTVLTGMVYNLMPSFIRQTMDSNMAVSARESFALEARNVEANLARKLAYQLQQAGRQVQSAAMMRKFVGAGMAIDTYKRNIIDTMGSLANATKASFNEVANAIRGDRRKSMDKVFNTKEVFRKAVSMLKMAQRNPEKVRQSIRAEVSKKQNESTRAILLDFASGLFDTKEDKYANMVVDQAVQSILSIGMNKKEFSIDNVSKFMYQSFAAAAKQLGIQQAGLEKQKAGKRSGKYLEMVKAVIGNDNAYKSFVNDLANRMAEKYQSRDAFNADFAELFKALRSNEWADGLRTQAIKDSADFLNYKFSDLFTYLGSKRNVNQEAVKQHIRTELQGTGASNELIEKFIQDTDKYLNDETSRILQDTLGFRIDQKTGKVIPKPLLSQKIQEEAEAQFKTIKNLKDITKLSMTDEGNFKDGLISRIITEVGMDREQATELAALISAQMEKAMLAQRSENVDRAIKKAQEVLADNKIKPTSNQRTILQKLVEMANMGVLDAEGVYEAFRKTHDFPKGFMPYDAEFTNTLREWGDRISKLPAGVIRSIEEEKMGRALMGKSNFSAGDILSSYWYFSLISQASTSAINALSGGFNLMFNVATWASYNPKSFFPMMRALYSAVSGKQSPAVNSFLYVMRNGLNPSGMQDEKRAKYPTTNVLEGATPENTPKIVYYLTNFGDGKINFLPDWMNTALKNVNPRQLMRLLKATDMFLREAAYEAKAAQLGASAFTRQGFDMAKRQAELELASSQATGKQKDQEILIRANEIYREQRLQDEEKRAIAEQASLETAFNQEPQGLFGMLANFVNALLAKYPATKFVIPFTNVAANVTNEFLNYTPIFSQFRLIRAKKSGMKDPFTQGRADKEYEIFVKGILGIAATLAPFIIQALTGGDEEDQEKRPYVQFYAEGPKDPRQKKIWQQRGGQKYSIRVGDTYYSYLYTPLVIPLASGAMLQEEIKSIKKKGEKLQAEDIGKLVASAITAPFSIGFVAVLNQSFLTGLADLLEFKESQNPVEKGTQFVGGIISRMLVPGAFRDINKLYTEDKAVGGDYLSNFLKDMPGSVNFLNKDVNYFGDDAKFPSAIQEEGFGKRLASVFGRIVSTEKPDPAWDVLYKNNLTPPAWDSSLSWDNGKRMTKEQELQFVREAGPMMRERITEISDELDELPLDEAQDLLSTEIRIIRREVKEDLQDRLEIPLDIE